MVSTVGTSTNTHPVLFAFEKKCFYANGRWWAWYYNGTYFGWETSVDGVDWSGSFTNYNALSTYYDLWHDEANNKICLARSQGATANIYYRQGTANSDGSITWDSNEVLVTTDKGHGISLCKDSDGYPWVGYRIDPSPYNEKVVKATTTNGSSWGTPTILWTQATRLAKILPLTGGKMLAISSGQNIVLQSRLYNGSSWETAVNASTSTTPFEWFFDAVADGDNVHLAFCKTTSYDIIYVKYVYGTGWGSEETVESSTVNQHHPSITFKSTDKVRVFYLLSQTTIKYRDRDSGAWQTAVTISSSESTMTCLSSGYKAFSSKLCVIWKSGAASPYDVKFEGYTLTIVKEVTDSLSLSDAVLRNKTLAISDSVGLVDTLLRDKIFQILDELNLTDIIFRDKTFTITDSISLSEIIEVITGAIIKYVADTIGLTEQIKVDKAFIVSDTINLLDQVFRHRPSVTITDAIVLAETIAAAKTLAITDQIALSDMALILKQLRVIDAINLADAVSTPSRILHALDSICLSDNAYVNKILIVSDQIALAEIVEKTVAGAVKTRIFLVLGDLAIQVCGG